jgi:hypothetical protein
MHMYQPNLSPRNPGLAPMGRPACPRCNLPLFRIPRRPLDFLVSIFAPVRRYGCQGMSCTWSGTLRYRTGLDSAHDAGKVRYHSLHSDNGAAMADTTPRQD